MGDDRLLSTAQAARELDVKPETVYAYVSRGLLTSVRSSGSRSSRFDPAEVRALAARGREGRRPTGALERIHSGLTLLEDDRLYFRGRDATGLVRLAGEHGFEAVARLLWTDELADGAPFTAPAALVDLAAAAVRTLPAGARLTDRVRVAVAAAAAADPLRYDLTPAVVTRRAEIVLAVAVDALPAAAGVGGLAARLAPVLGARPADVPLVDLMLLLLADHGLATSTLAARVAASARAHPYAVISAGLGAMDGQYHGTASTHAHRFLADALTDPVGALAERMRTGQHVPGFGHRVYRRVDPRAALLFDALAAHRPGTPILSTVDAVVAGLAGAPDMFPNVDLAIAAVGHALGLPADAGEAVFAIARMAGWVAHALEEYEQPGVRFRPNGVYTGPRPAGRDS